MATRVDVVHRVVFHIGVAVPTARTREDAGKTVARPESASSRVVIAGAQSVEADVGVEFVASKQPGHRRITRAPDEIAEGIVIKRVGYFPVGTAEISHIAMTIVTEVRGTPCGTHNLIL